MLVFNLKMAVLIVAGSLMTACVSAPPVVMEKAFQRKVITPCDNDVFCFRHAYSVTWDAKSSPCSVYTTTDGSVARCLARPSFPVTYKSNEYIVETGSSGYFVTLPAGGSVRMLNDVALPAGSTVKMAD